MQSRRTFLAGLAALPAAAQQLTGNTLEQAAGLVRRKKASPVELAEACLRRIETLNPSLNAFITVMAEQARVQARELESEAQAGRFRGPLHGVPVAVKDLFDTAGVRTTAASRQYENRVPREDADAVRLLKAAGAIVLGKLNMDEFAYNYTAETSFFGPSRNPWDTRRSPGGSSGGSAVAVASGMCFGALGSDTGGSIRLPAALCGIAGFKGSYGRVSTRGAVPLAWSLDHVGPMCRTARDAGIVFQALAGERREAPPEIRAVRLGVPRALFYENLDREVAAAVSKATDLLGRLGKSTEEVILPALPPGTGVPELSLPYLRVIAAEAYAFHETMLKSAADRYHPDTRQNIENGAKISAAEYILARREMEELRAGASRLFERVDVLVTPASPEPAFELGKPAGLIFLRNAAPWNLYGLPAISIPCGFTAANLPIGLQLTAGPGRDSLVLAVAAAYQQATDWHNRRPPERQ